MFDRRLLKNFDYSLLIAVLVISAYGLLVISSATRSMELEGLVARQGGFILAGLGGIAVILSIDYINFYNWSRYLYALNLLLLTLVFLVGRAAGGARRWIDLGIFDLQPSEIAKLIIIITLAQMLASRKEEIKNFGDLIPAYIHVLIPMLLIFLQPDLGTAIVFAAILFGMLFAAGTPVRHLLLTIGGAVSLFPLLWPHLEKYQKMRLLVFINPEMDPLGYGYQIMQSIIAIGSGGLSGKGLYEGPQAQLQFLPAQHTDFIFSVLGEELGFVGAVFLIALYVFVLYRILRAAFLSKDLFGMLLCCGVAVMFVFQILINIGMTMSIMPVTGLPLPFMSYGGSAMIVNMLSVGLVLNVGMRRHKIQF